MVTGLAVVAASVAACFVLVLVVFDTDAVREALGRAGRTLRLLPPEPPVPAGPPLDVLARDLRRLAVLTRTPPPDQSHVVRSGAVAAYDDALGQACAALDLPDTLGPLRPGPERDAERLRVEWLLRQRGLEL